MPWSGLFFATVCQSQGWTLNKLFFYTGIPAPADKRKWHEFWARKLAVMARQGVEVYSRSLRYRNQSVTLPDGTSHTFLAGSEKGVDVRLALDVTGAARRNELDVALVFSQDQDLSEAADEIRAIAQEQDRWIKIACGFPSSPTSRNRRGINKTDWIRIDKAT